MLSLTGRPIVPEYNSDMDDWSEVIWTLINYNRKSTYNRRNIQQYNVPRNNADFLQFMLTKDFSASNEATFEDYLKGDGPIDEKSEGENEPVIPMLFIEV